QDLVAQVYGHDDDGSPLASARRTHPDHVAIAQLGRCATTDDLALLLVRSASSAIPNTGPRWSMAFRARGPFGSTRAGACLSHDRARADPSYRPAPAPRCRRLISG